MTSPEKDQAGTGASDAAPVPKASVAANGTEAPAGVGEAEGATTAMSITGAQASSSSSKETHHPPSTTSHIAETINVVVSDAKDKENTDRNGNGNSAGTYPTRCHVTYG